MMEEKLSEQVERCLKSHSSKKRRSRVLRVLALVVAFATVYMLIVPAVTLSNETTCGLEAHTHSKKCYELKMVSPQPEIICGVENDADIVIHEHDEYCYDGEGNLICALPEFEGHTHDDDCYQEQQELTCTQAQEQGHTHTAACYARDRGELTCTLAEGEGHVHGEGCYTSVGGELTCTETEGGGHTHDSGCYTVTQSEVLTCSQSESGDVYDKETGELIESGHSHDESCYTVEESEELTCTQEESAGHTHDESCYAPVHEELTCTLAEGEGHVHGDGCYEWTERLTCTEPESETGHVHTDECYSHTEVLACTEPETELHVHDESCYEQDEDGNEELVCAKLEIIEHQHTAACLSVPEGEPEEKEVLVCGMEEHTHTDECYQELIPELGEKYFCGLAEHTHVPDCWFDSGELRCTLPEHLHSADCLDPELAGLLPPEQPAENAIWIDDTFEYNTDEFNMSFHVRGYAVPEYEAEGELYVSAGRGETALPGATASEQESGADAGQSIPDTASHAPAGAGDETEQPAGPSEETEPEQETSEAPEPVRPEPEAGPAESGDAAEPEMNGAEPDVPRGDAEDGEGTGEAGDAAESEPESEPVQEVEVSFGVVEEDADFADIAFADAGDGEPDALPEYDVDGEDVAGGETLLKKSITITAEVDGVKLDLSQCEITAQVTPTEFLLSALEETVTMYDMYYDPYMMEADIQLDEAPSEPVLTIASDGGVLAAANLAEGESAEAELPDNSFELTVSSQANPTFTVEYYAYLKTVDSRPENATENKLNVIDTSGGVLPVNGTKENTPTALPPRAMYLNESGNVVMRTDVQPLYKTHVFKYAKAPGLQYVNIIGDKVNENLAGEPTLKNYTLKEIWIQLGEGETADTARGERLETETVKNEDGSDLTVRWKAVTYTEAMRLTNLAVTAEKNPNCILIKNDAVIRLVYDTTDNNAHREPATLYDYDISKSEYQTGSIMEIERYGINNYAHTEGNAHYVFGNGNTGVRYSADTWLGNFINKANKTGQWPNAHPVSYGGCTFGIVQGFDVATQRVIFSEGIDGPELFGTEDADGKHQYKDSGLTFIRQGDTYTLSAVSIGGQQSGCGGVEKFTQNSGVWGNNFWPMDGVQNNDPKFGHYVTGENGNLTVGDVKYAGVDGDGNVKSGQYMPKSDDNTAHNSYFGMNFAVDFDLADDYVGPLEYWFFGDDDMWVFLTPLDESGQPSGESKLICDIGGVHSSVGEYVNLWDHVERERGVDDEVNLTEGDGSGNSQSQKYRLTFFYTERGASGSTCWMQFTLPTLAGVNLEDTIKTKVDEEHGALWIEKEVESPIPEDIYRDFTFSFKLEGGDGVVVDDSYVAYIRTVSGEVRPYGEDGSGAITSDAVFTLKHGEALAITNLPKDAVYTITEIFAPDTEPEFATTVDTKVEYLDKHEKYGSDPYVTGPVESVLATGPVEGATMTTVHYLNKSTEEVLPPFGDGDMGVLWLEKKVEGVRSSDEFKFEISLDFNSVEDKQRFLYDNTDFNWSGAEQPENGTYRAHVYIRSDLTNGEFVEPENPAELEVNGLKTSITVNLKDGEAIAITSLPPGTAYVVTENTRVFENFNVHYVQSFEAFERPDAPEGGNAPDGGTAGDAAAEQESADAEANARSGEAEADTQGGEAGADVRSADVGADTPNGASAGAADGAGGADAMSGNGTDAINGAEGAELPGENTILGEEATGTLEAGRTDKLVCVNSARYTFPETGAGIENSAMMYTLAGTLLILAAGCLWYRKKAVRGGG